MFVAVSVSSLRPPVSENNPIRPGSYAPIAGPTPEGDAWRCESQSSLLQFPSPFSSDLFAVSRIHRCSQLCPADGGHARWQPVAQRLRASC
jgi:hypothetical protein